MAESVMHKKVLDMSWYNDFECIGGKCLLTCCTTWWRIGLREEEIQKYEQMDHPLADEIREAIDKEEKCFKGDACDKCKLLTDDGWCRVVRECGEEYLSLTCRMYPRRIIEYGDVIERIVDLTCPEAATFLLKNEPIYFDYREEDIKGVFVPLDYDSYDAYSVVRNFLIELWQSDDRNISYADKYYIMLHLYYKFRHLEEKRRINTKTAKRMVEIYSKQEMIHSLAEISGEIFRDEKNCSKILHHFFSKTGDLMVGNVLTDRKMEYDIELLNKWLNDAELFAQNLNDYLTYFRKTYPKTAENYFVYTLFLFWMNLDSEHPEKVVLNHKFIVKCVEWIWIQFVAATVWIRKGRVDEFEVYIAEIDRVIDHNQVFVKMIRDSIQELHFDKETMMLALALF